MLKIFESRNKKISNLIQLGDYLGYSIRENVQLFSIDGVKNTVTYLTESNKIISGNYLIQNNSYILEDIEVQDSSVFTNDERFDEGVKNQVSFFLESLYHDDYTGADNKFLDVVDILTSRTHFQNISDKLSKKTKVFNATQNILESQEFSRFTEIIPELVSFLTENKDQITSQIPEILNSLKLSEAVSNAFNIPSVELSDLQKDKRFEFIDDSKKSIYEMICKQELVKKELLEAKNSFDTVWAAEPVIDTLSSKNEGGFLEALTAAIKELPYIALISKKKLFETLSRNLGNTYDIISEKELRSYVSLLFEMKKPARKQLAHMLSEKYGVNLQYLKESYSFKSLINTQVVLFESISKIVPKDSVMKEILSEFSTTLKGKNGIQGIDINNIIQQVFQHAGYSQEEIPLMESFSFNEVKQAFEKAKNLVGKIITEDDTSEGDEGSPVDRKKHQKDKKYKDNDEDDEDDNGEDDDDNGEGKKKKKKKGKKKEDEEDEDDDKKDKKDPGDLQEEEVEGEAGKLSHKMSDEEVTKAIKDLSDIVNSVDIGNEED